MRILCLLGRHDYQVALDHPDGKLGFNILECARCSKAVISDPELGHVFRPTTRRRQMSVTRQS